MYHAPGSGGRLHHWLDSPQQLLEALLEAESSNHRPLRVRRQCGRGGSLWPHFNEPATEMVSNLLSLQRATN